MDEFRNSQNWSKRFLPHYNAADKFQLITYRLADSLPQDVLKSLGAPHSDAGRENRDKRILVEATLDKGYGSCILKYEDVAAKVIEAWNFFNKERYELIAHVVMLNHVHVLIKTYEMWPLGKIVWSWKNFVSNYVFSNEEYKSRYLNSLNQVNTDALSSRAPESKKYHIKPASERGAPRNLSLWQREYWDRFIRDEKHFEKAVNYIHNNPVKAGLVEAPENWQWSSFNEKKS